MKLKSIIGSLLIVAIFLIIKKEFGEKSSSDNKFIYHPRELTQEEKYFLNDRRPSYPDSLNNIIEYKINTEGASEDLKFMNSVSDKWYRDTILENNPKVVSAYSVDFIYGEMSMILQVEPLGYTITKNGYEKVFSKTGIQMLAKKFGNVISSKAITLSGLKGGEFIIKSAPNSTNSSYALKYITLFKDNVVTLNYGVACNTDANTKKVFNDNLQLFQTLANRFKIIN